MLKINSRLNLIGLTISFAVFYLLMILVNYDLTYNYGIQDHDRLYMLATNEMAVINKYQTNCCKYYGEPIKDSVPGIEGGFWYQGSDILRPLYYSKNGLYTLHDFSVSTCHQDFFTNISTHLIEGSLDSLRRFSLVVTETMSRNLGICIGDTLKSDPQDKDILTVRAIISDFPKNSIFGNVMILYVGDDVAPDDFYEWSYTYVYKISEGANLQQVSADVDSLISRRHIDLGDMVAEGDNVEYRLFAFDGLYFNEEVVGDFVMGSREQTVVWISIQLMIVLISVVNFLNFFFARLPRKIRSINIRKIHGCSQMELVMMMVGETFLIVLAALILAGLAIWGISQTGLDFMVNDLTISLLDNMESVGYTILFALLICVAISLYPAFYVARINPIEGLKNTFVTPRKHRILKYTMIGFQYVVTFFLLFFFFATRQNCDYLINFDKGFQTANIYGAPISNTISRAKDSVRDDLLRYPGIKDVTFASGEFVEKWRMYWGRTFNNKSMKFFCYRVDHNFLKFFGIDMAEGQDFDPNDLRNYTQQLIFTKYSKAEFDLSLGDSIPGMRDLLTVRGFCNDFDFLPLQMHNCPFAFYYVRRYDYWLIQYSTMYVKVAEGTDALWLNDRVRQALARYDSSLDVGKINVTDFYTQNGKHYRQNIKFARLLYAFSIMSALICGLGLLGLVLFEAQSHRKEVAIRRICGASVLDVLLTINRKILIAMTLAFALSIPFAMLAIEKYYTFFAHHAQMPVWKYALGFGQVAIFTALVLTAACWKTANESPVEVIKEE